MSNLKIIEEALLEFKHTKNIIYIAVGCAAHMATFTDSGRFLEPKFDQQFPPFLRHIKNKYDDCYINFVLIDPSLEVPPYCISDEETHSHFTSSTVIDSANSIYTDLSNNMTVFALSQPVYFLGTVAHEEHCIDIMPFLTKIFHNAAKNGTLVFFSNYTGAPIQELAEHFDRDPIISQHLDHIIIGQSLRNPEESCYPNLDSQENNYVTFCRDGNLYVFNPYYYLVNSISLKDMPDMPDVQHIQHNSLTSYQIDFVKKTLCDNFKSITLSFLRRLKLISEHNAIIIQDYDLNYFSRQTMTNLNLLYSEQNYIAMIEIISQLCITQLQKIIKITSKQYIAEQVFDEIIWSTNKYKWTEIFDELFK